MDGGGWEGGGYEINKEAGMLIHFGTKRAFPSALANTTAGKTCDYDPCEPKTSPWETNTNFPFGVLHNGCLEQSCPIKVN